MTKIEFEFKGERYVHDDETFQTYCVGKEPSGELTQEVVAKLTHQYRASLPKPEKLKLNVGCGFRPFTGYINLDYDEFVHPDVVRNVDIGLPFDDDKFDETYSSHVIEHIGDVFLFMAEIWRVTKKSGKVTIICPNGHNMFASIEPDHKRQISYRFFDRWRPNHKSVQNELKQLMGAQFNYISRELINNEMELKFVLEVIKNG
jgi:predicted SAM-dependent methyltransferase